MRNSQSERYDASFSSLPRALAGRRSLFSSVARGRAAALLSAALFCAASGAQSPEPDRAPASTAEILGAVVTIHVQPVSNARGASSDGRERQGTGVVVEPGGFILTTALLVQEADSIVVTTFDARTVLATVAAQDPALAIAVLRPAAPLGVRPLPVGNAAALEPRTPLSVASAARSRAVAVATVVNKSDFATAHELLVEDAIFTAPLVRECAGAALVDGTGKLVGVGALPVKELAGKPADGNVFIPVEHFLPALAHLARADGTRAPRRPWLGLVTERAGDRLVVTDLPAGSPAARAGLQVGDAIRAVEGTAVGTHAELYRGIWRAGRPGTAVRLTIERGGTLRDVKVRAIEAQDYLIHRA